MYRLVMCNNKKKHIFKAKSKNKKDVEKMNKLTNKEIKLYIGLSQKDMKTQNTKIETLKAISRKLIAVGVIGFSMSVGDSYYKPIAKKIPIEEKTIIVSFINTYGLRYNTLKTVINTLKTELKQESILLTINPIAFEFL